MKIFIMMNMNNKYVLMFKFKIMTSRLLHSMDNYFL